MQLRKHKRLILSIGILSLIITFIIGYFLSKSLNTIVNIIIASFILAYTLSPIRDTFEARLKVSRKIASILVISIIIGIVAACIIVIVPALFNEIANISNILDNVNNFFYDISERFKLKNVIFINMLYNDILEKGNSIWMKFSENAIDNLIKFSDNIVSFAIIPIMIYYFLCDGNKIYSKSLLLLSTEKRELTRKFLKDIDRVLTRYIASQLLLSGLIGLLTFFLLLILKVKFPLWISILNAILNIIPYFGPIFGAVPAVIVALLDSPVKALWVIVGMFLIQQIEGDILAPKMTGDSTDMHPFVIIILLLIGDTIGGFLGMILAVPIAVIIKVLYDDINYYLF
jgi:predicted PurR-regulated permease PerM